MKYEVILKVGVRFLLGEVIYLVYILGLPEISPSRNFTDLNLYSKPFGYFTVFINIVVNQ